ncbi:hypothetical protein H6G25_02950 [Dolichospermum sp. FACHB-1091]|uniref:hypothetical protein n=1 Tax=Dolichospermum sp. FACHB-1091 TaxID=2692798 RepID=UPI0016804C72|nr:hypothetical protein [Dolichospermum sp. FACHB-1091]MBD2442180.1 hypothetical protein [Dolichospermum sp. FACHB-1091]
MKTTTKVIFSLGLISFLTLGAMSQNAFAADSTPSIHPKQLQLLKQLLIHN